MIFDNDFTLQSKTAAGTLRSQRGISLNEFILYIFLASLAITTIIITHQMLKTSVNNYLSIEAITNARTQLIHQFSGESDMSQATLAQFIHVLPPAWHITLNGLVKAGPLNGTTIDFQPSVKHTGDATMFFKGLTRNQCLTIFPRLGHGWVEAYASDTARVRNDSDMAAVSRYGAVNSEALNKQCTSNANSIALVISNND